MKKMQGRLTLIIVMGIIFATFFSGTISLLNFFSVEIDRSHNLLNKELDMSAGYLNESFKDVENMVEVLSDYYIKMLPDSYSVGNIEDTEYVEKCEYLANTIALHNSFISAVYFRISPDIAEYEKSGFFMTRTVSNSHIEKYELTRIEDYSEDDISHVGWYYIPKNRRRAVWMDEYENLNNGIRTISYVKPLYAGDGTFLGVVGIDMDMKEIYKHIAKVRIYDTGFAVLMSQNGTIRNPSAPINITEKEKEEIMKSTRTMSTTYIDNRMRMTLLAKKMQNGDYLLITVQNNDLYSREIKVVFTIIIITIIVSILVIFLLTGVLYKMIHRFSTDNLTKVGSRSAYTDVTMELDEEIQKNRNVRFSVVVFDINGLKRVNDEQGHSAGDQLIIDAAETIKKYFPKTELYRIGGDEFVILSKRRKRAVVAHSYELFQREMRKRTEAYDKESGIVIISSGMAVYQLKQDHCYEDTFKRADYQMYQEKEHFYHVTNTRR